MRLLANLGELLRQAAECLQHNGGRIGRQRLQESLLLRSRGRWEFVKGEKARCFGQQPVCLERGRHGQGNEAKGRMDADDPALLHVLMAKGVVCHNSVEAVVPHQLLAIGQGEGGIVKERGQD
jgi:hypothetical protein